MALRLTRGPETTPREASVGGAVEVRLKVENSGAAEARLSASVEDLKEGALGRPVEHAIRFQPEGVLVRGKSHAALTFTWTASLPTGRTAFTFRGRFVLRGEDGRELLAAPFEVFVRAPL